jgi:hypothetical protein
MASASLDLPEMRCSLPGDNLDENPATIWMRKMTPAA